MAAVWMNLMWLHVALSSALPFQTGSVRFGQTSTHACIWLPVVFPGWDSVLGPRATGLCKGLST